MYYHLKHINSELEDMARKLSFTAISNVEWSCLFSGMGIVHPLSEKDFKKLFKIQECNNDSSFDTANLAPIKCIYKKGKPAFAKSTEKAFNNAKYTWDNTNFNKLILPSTQAFAILSLCSCSEIMREQDITQSQIFLKYAEIFYDFTSTYLRNSDGLFVSVQDKTKNNFNDELKLKILQKETRLLDQILIHEAFLHLYKLSSYEDCKETYNANYQKYLNDFQNIFQFIFENYHTLFELSSKEISLCVSSLSRCCNLNSNQDQIVNYHHLIALLCDELESRIKVTGEVEKSYKDYTPASLITHFKVASALIEGYMQTNIEKFKEQSFRIFAYLDELFDISTGLFIQGDDEKITFSIRDASEIIKALILYYINRDHSKTLDTLIAFYNSSIMESGIIQSIPNSEIIFQGNRLVFPDSIRLLDETGKAPVFLKSFRFNFNKALNYTVSKHYNSLYSLYSSYLFLHYIHPITTKQIF